MPQQDIKETVKGVAVLVNLREKYPVGFTVVVSIIMFVAGNFWGRMDSADEVQRKDAQIATLQKTQTDIVIASLANQGIIVKKTEINAELRSQNDTLKQINDTLSTTINQVGTILQEAKKPALKILNK